MEIAAAAGLPRDSFGQCLREGRYADWVRFGTDEMSRRGVNRTPTVFVDGKRLDNPTAERLSSAIQAAAGAP